MTLNSAEWKGFVQLTLEVGDKGFVIVVAVKFVLC